jgi:multidrug transporter EmrE-like cation transporter
LSVVFSLGGAISFHLLPMQKSIATEIRAGKPLLLGDLWRFRDRQHSKIIFALDGFFLYMESYFWLVSLFLLVKKSFFNLGLLVIFLAVVFGIIFFFIKNRIDHSNTQKVYLLAVILYMASWYMRGFVGKGMDTSVLYPLLISITFCTSFFRLAFNKRFFDHAKATGGSRYILLKSYYSQFFLSLIFAGLACYYSFSPQLSKVVQALGYTYFAAGGLALIYLLYPASQDGERGW